MPSAPRRIADCTARFIARRKATRRSSCWAIDSATNVASISGLRTSTILMTTSRLGELRHGLADLVDVGALLADDDARTRRIDRHAALLVRPLDDDLRHRRLLEHLESEPRGCGMSSCSSLPYSPLLANQRESQVRLMPRRRPIGLTFCPIACSSSPGRCRRFDLAHDDGQIRKRLLDPPGAAARARLKTASSPGPCRRTPRRRRDRRHRGYDCSRRWRSRSRASS